MLIYLFTGLFYSATFDQVVISQSRIVNFLELHAIACLLYGTRIKECTISVV
jgi:hypothetical protein